MRTNNAMQLKARVNNRAKEAGIPAQMMMQNYLLERLLERISLSPWRNSIVVKGGMLISSLVGVSQRTTMDLDTTVQGFTLTHESAEKAFREIAAIQADDDWTFEFTRTDDIREADDYPGIRVHLLAKYASMEVPLTVDVTTSDKITPSAVEYSYPLLFDDREIVLMAYPLETVLAEKLETVISRGTGNTRPRDYYDIHVLWTLKGTDCDIDTLTAALSATASRRGSLEMLQRWDSVLSEVAANDAMQGLWAKYVKTNAYAAGIMLEEVCKTTKTILGRLDWNDWVHT